MVTCRITVTTPAGVVSYTGLFRSTTSAAFDAISRYGARNATVRAERA